MATELFKSVSGIDMQHIPCNSSGLTLPDLLGGRVTMIFLPIAAALPLARAGKLRAVAVTHDTSTVAPQYPTIAESAYPGFEFTGWIALLTSAKTPKESIHKIYLETAKALTLSDERTKFADLGMEAVANSRAEFTAILKSEIPMGANVIKHAGIKQD
jgi:tripartite-type tricarboxylate transporter receptor subunit TctC